MKLSKKGGGELVSVDGITKNINLNEIYGELNFIFLGSSPRKNNKKMNYNYISLLVMNNITVGKTKNTTQ